MYLSSDTDLDRSFHCPTCKVYAVQRASLLRAITFGKLEVAKLDDRNLLFLDCDGCGARILFADEQIIFPKPLPDVPEPNADLNADIKKDYWEAAKILEDSVRGACALLRLCLMRLMLQLELSGDLNVDIQKLVERGLDAQVQEACDVVRIVGNGAVHPGKLDLRDDVETATKLFDLINFISEQMISQPKKRSAFFQATVPESAKQAIKRRDAKSRDRDGKPG